MIELLHTDCMTYMATLPDAAFDLAIVDPPYGRGEDGGTNRCHGVKQKNGKVLQCVDGGYAKKDWDREPPPPEYFDELRRVARHQIVWGANYMPVKLQGGAIVWDKVNDGADQSGAEIAYNSLNERVDVVRYMWRGMMQGDGIGSMRQQGNKALNERRIHPTQKPVKLYEWLLQQYAQPGMKILDTHLGSGSAAIAAHYYGVDFVGCEIDADYWRAANERFEAETRQMALLAPNMSYSAQRALDRKRKSAQNAAAKAAADQNVVKGEVPEGVVYELCAAKTTAKDYAAAFADAIKEQAAKYGVKPAALRRFVTARESDKLDEAKAECNDLANLIG